jgi:hypothetical protein
MHMGQVFSATQADYPLCFDVIEQIRRSPQRPLKIYYTAVRLYPEQGMKNSPRLSMPVGAKSVRTQLAGLAMKCADSFAVGNGRE